MFTILENLCWVGKKVEIVLKPTDVLCCPKPNHPHEKIRLLKKKVVWEKKLISSVILSLIFRGLDFASECDVRRFQIRFFACVFLPNPYPTKVGTYMANALLVISHGVECDPRR